MLHKAWNSKEEMPYCFPRSSIKIQGHTGQNITDLDPNWAFPDYRPVAAFKSLKFALFLVNAFICPSAHHILVLYSQSTNHFDLCLIINWNISYSSPTEIIKLWPHSIHKVSAVSRNPFHNRCLSSKSRCWTYIYCPTGNILAQSWPFWSGIHVLSAKWGVNVVWDNIIALLSASPHWTMRNKLGEVNLRWATRSSVNISCNFHLSALVLIHCPRWHHNAW